jgi:hypothetical protein
VSRIPRGYRHRVQIGNRQAGSQANLSSVTPNRPYGSNRNFPPLLRPALLRRYGDNLAIGSASDCLGSAYQTGHTHNLAAS